MFSLPEALLIIGSIFAGGTLFITWVLFMVAISELKAIRQSAEEIEDKIADHIDKPRYDKVWNLSGSFRP